jgi:two-component system, NtrC family, response regulator AtoC
MKMLLVEDDKRFGQVLKRELEDEIHLVQLASDGVEAVLDFVDASFDIVLLDVRMPRLNGLDALRIIRKFNPLVPVIVFSADSRPEELLAAGPAGEAMFLAKPFEIARLKREITRLTAGNTPLAFNREY